MSRPLGILDEQPLSTFIDREALMMDGGRLFFQLVPEDAGGVEPVFGGQLFNPDTGELLGTISPIEITAGINKGKTLIIGPDGVPRIFTGGTFLTGQNSLITLSDSGIQQLGTRNLSIGGTDGSAPSFASTQAAQTQAETFARGEREAAETFRVEQDRLDREAAAEQNRLAEEAAQKRNRLGVLSDLIQSFVSSQAQARDTLANLQPDPFRFAAVAGGIAPFGVTPQQGFTQQLQQFAGAPVPMADPNASLPSIQSAIQGLTGANVPLAPQIFGAAGGAMIPAPSPGQSIAVKVGERGEEILRITAQGVEVIPITAGAQEGGFFPFQPIEFDKSTLLPALGTSGIFGSLGFESIPTTTRDPTGTIGIPGIPSVPTTVGALGKLGIQPSLIQNPAGMVFVLDPSTGQYRGFTNFDAFSGSGFQTENIVRLAGPDFNALTQGKIGTQISSPIDPASFVPTEQPSPFTRFSAPIIEPTTGTLLPAPFQVASQLNRLRLTNPTAFNLLLSAYQAAGVPAEAVLSGVQASLPFGQARGNIGLR